MTAIDIIDTQAMVPVERPSSLVVLAAPVGEIVAAQRSYHEVCQALLDENDVQLIGAKVFKKRSAWNKLAVAFAVSTTEVRTTHERDERGRIVRTECVVRAEAPNGRRSDGIGACDLYERCCDPDTCTKRETWPDSGKPTGHTHCSAFPCKQTHFSNAQHDIPATAFTRASNRAKADLFGMGEVSAEEVSQGASAWHGDDSMPITRSTGTQPGSTVAKAAAKSGTKMVSEGQAKLIHAVSGKLNYGTAAAAVGKFTGTVAEPETLTLSDARKVIDGLKAEEDHGPMDAGADEATGEIVDAEEAMHILAGLISEVRDPDVQEVVKSHLRGRFGPSKDMSLDVIRQATDVVLGWPDTATTDATEYPPGQEPF